MHKFVKFYIRFKVGFTWGLPGSSMVKNLPAIQETNVQSLGQEDPLEDQWQLTPVFLPGESHGWRGLVGYSPQGCKRVGYDVATK